MKMIPLKKSKYDNATNKFWVVFGNDYQKLIRCKLPANSSLWGHCTPICTVDLQLCPSIRNRVYFSTCGIWPWPCDLIWPMDISTCDPSRGLKKCLCSEVHLLLILRTLLLPDEGVWDSFLEDVRSHGERLPTALVEAPDM